MGERESEMRERKKRDERTDVPCDGVSLNCCRQIKYER